MIEHRRSVAVLRWIAAVLVVCTASLGSIATAAAAAGVPSRVSGISIYSAGSTLEIRITPPNNNGSRITKYVAACTGAGKTIWATSVNTLVTVTPVTDNAFYLCSIRAVNAIGVSPRSYVRPGMPGASYEKYTVRYCSPDGLPQLMDVFRPKNPAPVPVVLFVHGGEWYSGTRKLDGSMLATMLTSRGFALATIDYRLAPAVNPAEQLEDVACAVRFLRAHAAKLGILPDRIGGMGTSAGGNLISMLGVNPPPASPDVQWSDQSDQLQAVIDEFGVTEFGPDQMTIMPNLFSYFGTQDQQVIDSYGPVNYASSVDAPFLIVHGELDGTVPFHEAADFYDALQWANVPATLIPVANVGHGFQPVGGDPSPSMVSVDTAEINFLTQYLK